jgi:hypothetical protein
MATTRTRKCALALIVLAAAGSAAGQARGQQEAPSLPPPVLGPHRDVPDDDNEIADGLRQCSSETDPADRLKCYERIERALPENTAGHPAADRKGDWIVVRGMDQSVTVGVGATDVQSDDDAHNHARASLFVRCRSSQLNVWLAVQPNAVPPGDVALSVALRFDDGAPPPPALWATSTTGSSVGLWTTVVAGPVARRLMEARTASARIGLGNDKTLYAHFQLVGGQEVIGALRTGCKGW